MSKEATAPIGSEVGRKLSVRELGWDKAAILKAVLDNQNAQHFLGRFVGVTTSLKPYRIKDGDRAGEMAYGLMGQFKGIAPDGSEVGGSVLYLPGYVNDMVIAALQSSEDVASVRLGFDIYAQYDASSATSYVFTARDLLNTQAAGVAEVETQIQALPLPGKTLAIAAS